VEIVGVIDPDACIRKRAVIPLDERMFIGTVRRADREGHAQAQPEAQKRRWNIALLGRAHEAYVAVNRNGCW
jgi:hypothetical protein